MTSGQERGLPSGWYRDPVHLHAARFWDGENWTDQVVDTWEGSDDPPSSLDVWMGTRQPVEVVPDAGVVIDLREVTSTRRAERTPVVVGTNGHRSAAAAVGARASRPATSDRGLPAVDEPLIDVPEEWNVNGARHFALLQNMHHLRGRAWQDRASRIARAVRTAAIAGLLLADVVLYRKLR